MKKLNQQKQIFFNGQLCTFIFWETLTAKGELAVKTERGFYNAKIKELKN